MPVEFRLPSVELRPEVQHAISETPFNQETDDFAFRGIIRQFHESGKALKTFFEGPFEKGLGDALATTATFKDSLPYVFINSEGLEEYYDITYVGEQTDRLGQAIDVFQFTPSAQEQSTSRFIMTTQKGKERFSEIASFILFDARKPIISHQFQFYGETLLFMHQTSRAGHLFREWPDESRQLVLINFNISNGLLTVLAGSEESLHLYQNLNGLESRTFRSRVSASGDMRLIIASPNGMDFITKPFSIPNAISMIADFEPATAA